MPQLDANEPAWVTYLRDDLQKLREESREDKRELYAKIDDVIVAFREQAVDHAHEIQRLDGRLAGHDTDIARIKMVWGVLTAFGTILSSALAGLALWKHRA